MTEQPAADGAESRHDKKKKHKRHNKEQDAVKKDEIESSANNDSKRMKKHKRKRTECDDSAQISEDLDVVKQTASLSNGGHACKKVHLDSRRKHKHKRKSTCTA